jgi:hypothetical protein
MPFEITLPVLPAGYAISSVKEGEECPVAVREFTSSEDGDVFISRLDGFPSQIIDSLPRESGVISSIIDHMLVLIRRDRTAKVYINNEVQILAEILNKSRNLEAGDIVYEDDIADVRKIAFKDISIPADVGILLVFSHGWRKGLFYDFRPLVGQSIEPRDYDLEMLCGQYYAYLSFQHLFKITEDQWTRLLDQKWFPFISLKKRTIKEMIGYARNGRNIDELTERIASEVAEMIPSLLEKWEKNNLFDAHHDIFKRATERFIEKDYISATHLLYTRIKGLMRTYHLDSNQTDKVNQTTLMNAIIEAKGSERHPYSLLLPINFLRYLKDVYFAGFDPKNPNVLSRHTVSHGVVPTDLLSLKGATIGLLILDQLSFYVGSQKGSS